MAICENPLPNDITQKNCEMSKVQENSSGDVEDILILSGQEHALGGDNSTQVGQLCVKELAI